jgi:hypothetical protein
MRLRIALGRNRARGEKATRGRRRTPKVFAKRSRNSKSRSLPAAETVTLRARREGSWPAGIGGDS